MTAMFGAIAGIITNRWGHAYVVPQRGSISA